MNQNKTIALVGGAGYIGLSAANYFLERGYKVTVLDNLIYGQEYFLRSFLFRENFEFINFDLRDIESLDKLKEKLSNIVLLAGLVGDPITTQYPEISNEINGHAIRNFISKINELNATERFVFISTCSNYGLIPEGSSANEEFELNPLSLYAEEKVKNEKFIIKDLNNFNFSPTILRFSTAFGAAPRMRFDLTVNEFIRDIFLNKDLEVYDPDTWRPYCHVNDFAELIYLTLDADRDHVHGEIFNAGGQENNHTKRQIVEIINSHFESKKIKFLEKGKDRRDYKVNFSKVKNILNFTPKWTVPMGVEEVIRNLQSGLYSSEISDPNFYGNYKL
tara:strand:+ start:905 stop:1903 length:999 start_codon:yes stop_codon:yes gene_type:complete